MIKSLLKKAGLLSEPVSALIELMDEEPYQWGRLLWNDRTVMIIGGVFITVDWKTNEVTLENPPGVRTHVPNWLESLLLRRAVARFPSPYSSQLRKVE